MARTLALFTGAIVVAQLAIFAGEAWGQVKTILPREMNPQLIPRVKQSTAYIKVTLEQGSATGSGFLAVEPGIVVTNAHVIGMLERNNKPPSKIEVILNSGEPNETQLGAAVLAVDRAADLAVLRIDAKMVPPTSTPLTLDMTQNLFETQKVYVFGFPFATQIGSNVTVVDTTVSALRKDATGALQKIQVNGGMYPGNSGGPVVNSLGQVTGVAVSVLRGTTINFAIPVMRVVALMQGKTDEVKTGEIYREGDEVRVPLRLTCLDPLKRLKEVKVEVWAGKPTDKFAVTPKAQTVLPKEAMRQSQKMNLENDVATLDVILPKLAAGQVAWVQPVLVLAKDSRWAPAIPFDASLAVERVPADLIVKQPTQLRSVHLKMEWSVAQGKDKLIARSVELDLLESLRGDARGAIVNTAIGSLKLMEKTPGMEKEPPGIGDALSKLAPSYFVDATNKISKKTPVPLDRKLIEDEDSDDDYFWWFTHVFLGYEAGNLVLPNKPMQPNGTWQAISPMEMVVFSTAQQQLRVTAPDMNITYTYEGTRTRAGNREALISFEGRAKAASRRKKDADWGPVWGKFTFDLERGFISSVKLTLAPDIAELDMAIEVDLTRVEGNPTNISLPKINEALEKQLRIAGLADVQSMLKKLAAVKVEDANFLSVKDGMDSGKKIFGEVPAWLQERTFHFKDLKAGITQFTTESDGVVLMAVSPRFRSGQSLVAPNGGAFGGIREPWYWDCVSKADLVGRGWQECGTVPLFGSSWPLFHRDCKKGENFKVRTEKEWAPIIIK